MSRMDDSCGRDDLVRDIGSALDGLTFADVHCTNCGPSKGIVPFLILPTWKGVLLCRLSFHKD